MENNMTVDDCVALALKSYVNASEVGFKAVPYCVVYAATMYGFSDDDCVAIYDKYLNDDKYFDEKDGVESVKFLEYIKGIIEFEIYLKTVDVADLIDVKFVR